MYDHPTYHVPSLAPIPGCPTCDQEARRPVRLGFGDGASTQVVPAAIKQELK